MVENSIQRASTFSGRAGGLRKWSTLEMESEESHPLAVSLLRLYSIKKSHRVQCLGKDNWWDYPSGEREAAQKFCGTESFQFSWWQSESIHLEILFLGLTCCPIKYQLTGFGCGPWITILGIGLRSYKVLDTKMVTLAPYKPRDFRSWFMWHFLGVAK